MPTAILSALPEEQTGLAELLAQARSIKRADRVFHTGLIHGLPVVLALSGIGKVAAATTATVLIEHFGVRQIIFTGVAGGLHATVQVGDLVVGSQYVQHDMDASPIFPRFMVPSAGMAIFPADHDLIATLLIAVKTISKRASADIGYLKVGNIHQGLIASGDRFVSSASEVHALRQALPEALCVEMEGAAVAQVCHDYALPFAAVRAISDRADDAAHTDFPCFVREVAGPVATALMGAWLEKQSLL